MAFSMSAKFIPSTLRITGTTRPWESEKSHGWIFQPFTLEASGLQSTNTVFNHLIHLAHLWCGHSHTDVHVVPVHNLFGRVIDDWNTQVWMFNQLTFFFQIWSKLSVWCKEVRTSNRLPVWDVFFVFLFWNPHRPPLLHWIDQSCLKELKTTQH